MNNNRLFDLSGKLAVVTGGTRGIGYAIAQGLADAGADLVLSRSPFLDHPAGVFSGVSVQA
jgi:NAD(P)-dependent dehydrogenase (short-subunit alcohol dehydrogenase family)